MPFLLLMSRLEVVNPARLVPRTGITHEPVKNLALQVQENPSAPRATPRCNLSRGYRMNFCHEAYLSDKVTCTVGKVFGNTSISSKDALGGIIVDFDAKLDNNNMTHTLT